MYTLVDSFSNAIVWLADALGTDTLMVKPVLAILLVCGLCARACRAIRRRGDRRVGGTVSARAALTVQAHSFDRLRNAAGRGTLALAA